MVKSRFVIVIIALASYLVIYPSAYAAVTIELLVGNWKIDCGIEGPSGLNHNLVITPNKYTYRQGEEGAWEDVLGEIQILDGGILVVTSGFSQDRKGAIFRLKGSRLVDEVRSISLERCSD